MSVESVDAVAQERARIIGMIRRRAAEARRERLHGAPIWSAYWIARGDALADLLTELEREQ